MSFQTKREGKKSHPRKRSCSFSPTVIITDYAFCLQARSKGTCLRSGVRELLIVGGPPARETKTSQNNSGLPFTFGLACWSPACKTNMEDSKTSTVIRSLQTLSKTWETQHGRCFSHAYLQKDLQKGLYSRLQPKTWSMQHKWESEELCSWIGQKKTI